MARTQQQRREATVARLLQASIDTILEVGYARASAAVITKRAGMSVGALFRHFETMGDFMAATASEVLRRQLETFTKRVAEIPADRPALEAVLTIQRDITSSPTNAVLYELMIAGRTDEKLNAHLQDVFGQYTAKIHDTARALRGAEAFGGDVSGSGGFVDQRVRWSGPGAGLLPDWDIEDRRIQLLAALITTAWAHLDGLSAQAAQSRPSPHARRESGSRQRKPPRGAS